MRVATPGPLPPDELVSRIGLNPERFKTIEDRADAYDWTGKASFEDISAALPRSWSWRDKRVLDFGCGSGRVLRWFLPFVAEGATLTACDIHAPSIEWLRANYPDEVRFFVNEPDPPLSDKAETYDLVYCGSVFSHLPDWAPWLAELHRVLRPDGLLVASIHGRGFWDLGVAGSAGVPWDEDRIGLHVEYYGETFEDSFGPAVYASEWWLRSHWGRLFEILRYEPTGFAFQQRREIGQAWVVARRAARNADAAELERPDDPRELEAALFSRELVLQEIARIHLPEVRRLRAQLAVAQSDPARLAALEAELAESRKRYAEIASSASWRLTKPLRAAAALARRASASGREGHS